MNLCKIGVKKPKFNECFVEKKNNLKKLKKHFFAIASDQTSIWISSKSIVS